MALAKFRESSEKIVKTSQTSQNLLVVFDFILTQDSEDDSEDDYDNVWNEKSTLPPELRVAAIVEKHGLNWQQALEYAVKHRKVKAKEVNT